MGQYYIVVILADSMPETGKQEIIRYVINPHNYYNGAKLMEHSYFNNNIVNLVEWLISPEGMFYKSRIVWAGDYADGEPIIGRNLYHVAIDSYVNKNVILQCPESFNTYTYKYIVNHTKREYVSKERELALKIEQHPLYIHPLPLLISEGNQCGSGDYYGKNDNLCGKWSRDIISVEENKPEGYTELICDFQT